MAAGGEDVYCTLVMNDAYLPGAAVLAHSLRDTGTTKKLACMIVQDTLRPSTIEELQSLYNYVIPVKRIGNPNPANLYLMNRPDLLYTFTKLNLWRLTQFRKIVYLDSDTVALRAPEELFDLPDSFAAAPDVGWPDAFNSGVMVLTPDMGEYHSLRGLAGAGDSFDGADQGLLNQYFENRSWKRLSFTYNTTPSANYQYEPAYRYYKRNISIVHFIGSDKPWQRGRSVLGMSSAFQELLSRWWAVYDRHFHVSTQEYIDTGRRHPSQAVRDQVYQEQPATNYGAAGYPIESTQPAPPPGNTHHHNLDSAHSSKARQQYHHQNRHTHNTPPHTSSQPAPQPRRFSAPHMEWDATRGAPPVESKPEASNFPTTLYDFNNDPTPFRPPTSYPDAPKDMWYSVPEKPKPVEKLKPLFPWEERQDYKPSRRFIDDEAPPPPPPEPEPQPSYLDELEVTADSTAPGTPVIRLNDQDPWQTVTHARNAWDDDTGIEKYVRQLTSFQRNRGKVQVVQTDVPSQARPTPHQHSILSPGSEPDAAELIDAVRQRRESLILTDFPTPIERPSLPVTPAPRRRSTLWGEDKEGDPELPTAAGVPDQADWNPAAQLEQLRRNSLLGPAELTLPTNRRLSNREMPSTSAPIPEQLIPMAAIAEDKVPELDQPGEDDAHSVNFAKDATASPSTHKSTHSPLHSPPILKSVPVKPQKLLPTGPELNEQTEINTALNAAITAPADGNGENGDDVEGPRVLFAEPGFAAAAKKVGAVVDMPIVDEVDQKEADEHGALSPTEQVKNKA